MLRVAVILIVLFAAPARAGDLEAAVTKHVVVDWSAAELRARGAAPADLRAPSPAVARTKALRQAREQARARLAEAVGKLPAVGASKAGALDDDQLEAVLASAAEIERSFGSDGSARVTLALGTEAVRVALAGPLAPGQGTIDTIWVDARAVALTPAVGYTVRVGDLDYQGPAIFYASKKAGQGDRRIGGGARAKQARAVALDRGVVTLDGIDAATLKAANDGNALVVFLVKPARTSK